MAEKTNEAALALAIQFAGGQQALASICGCSRQSINQAVATRRGLPAQYVDKVSETLGIPRHVLRRDLYYPAEYDE